MRTSLGVRLALLLALIVSTSSCAVAAQKSVAVSPTSAAFGTQTAGTTSQVPVIISNNGQGSIQVTSATIAGSTSFVVTNWAGPYVLPKGQSVTLNISFTPAASNSYAGTLTVNSSAGSPTVQLTGSGGGTSSPISVSISPTSTSLQTSATQQFAANVTNTTNTGVIWSVNGVQGGNTTVGTISTSGLYSAPSSAPSSGSVSVTAQSIADTTKSASASVSITTATVSVSVSPSSATLATGATQQFSATVSGGSNSSVSWFVGGIQGGNATVGTISSAGLYSAPSVLPSTPQVTVAAQSVASPTSSGSSTVSLVSTGGHDYYVSNSGSNSNSGTATAPWQTISYAATRVIAGDTVHVLPGTYPESVIINSAGGTANAHIRFISDTKWGAKLIGGGVDRAAYRVNSGQYIDIIGFDVSNNYPYPSGTQGIEMYDSNDSALNNHVHDIPGSQYGGGGIHTYPQANADDKIIGNVIHNIGDWTGMTLNPGNQMTHGIYIESLRADVENNIVYRNQAWGIHMFHTPYNDTITNNVVFQNGWGGIIVEGSCTEYAGGSGMNDYTTVSNNVVVDNGKNSGPGNGGRGGIIEDGCTGTHNVYYNNISWNNEREGCIETCTNSNWYLLTGTAAGNFDTDPLFVNYQPDGTGDYHLQSGSVGIDGGTTAGATMGFAGAPRLDIGGGARPVGKGWDIGIYEMGSTPATWPWY